MDGLLLIDKVPGLTSHDVVHKVRGLVRRITGTRKPKVGHTGTLDPFATGVLPICIGQTTRLARFLLEGEKHYRATMLLGQSTDTDDCEGKVLHTADANHLTEEEIKAAIMALLGDHMQVPPIFSAIHVNGKRAYEWAREGVEVKLDPRPITIYEIVVESIALPEVVFSVRASKGTYIRALCRDLGQTLGVGAHCTALRRLEAAGFKETESFTLESLQGLQTPEELSAHVLSPAEMMRGLTSYEATAQEVIEVRHGRRISLREGVVAQPGQTMRLVHDGQLICVATLLDNMTLQPERVMKA